MSKGNLKPRDFKCVQSNYRYLKNELEPRNIVDFLFEKNVITLDEKERIQNQEPKSERSECLLLALFHCGPGDAFDIFLKSLEEKYPHVLDKLERNGETVDEMKTKDEGLKDKDKALKAKDEESKAKDDELKAKDDELKAKDDELKAKDDELKAKEDLIKYKDQIEVQLKYQLDKAKGEIETQRNRITDKVSVIKAKDDEILQLKNKLGETKKDLRMKEQAILKLQSDYDKAIRQNMIDRYTLYNLQRQQAMDVTNDEYDFEEFEKNTRYLSCFYKDHPTIKMFWEVFHDMSTAEKKNFLVFLTGCDRIPVSGMRDVTMTIQPLDGDDIHLPVAHQCYNQLDLPYYTNKSRLKERLEISMRQNGFSML